MHTIEEGTSCEGWGATSGSFFGGMFGSKGVEYFCPNYGTKHNQIACPNCGSKMKAGF